jgi:ketosteroid isomerase-like protein
VLAERIAATEDRRAYRLETETARETTAQLFHVTAGPWGGPAVAVQIVAVYTDHASQKRYATPGAAFFQLSDGKIRRARVYLGDGERAEIEPDPTKKKP